jgi:hypothetical protein
MSPELTADDRAELRRIVARLAEQDNACTSEPMFCVQKAVRRGGLDPELGNDIMWVHDGEACPEAWWPTLNMAHDNDDETVVLDGDTYRMEGFDRYGYKDDHETVMVCLTREGCEQYLKNNGHNLDRDGETRIMVESFHRAPEMIALRRMLPALAAGMDEIDRLRSIIARADAALNKKWPDINAARITLEGAEVKP